MRAYKPHIVCVELLSSPPLEETTVELEYANPISESALDLKRIVGLASYVQRSLALHNHI